MTASKIQRTESALRDIAMAYPEAHEDFPWGERAIKIKGKVFVFMFANAEQLSLTTKLPASSEMALLLPYVSPTGYGLGKSGWVTAKFGPRDEAPIEMLREWIDESFRAVAPKKLVAQLDAPAVAVTAGPAATAAKASKAKVAVKTPAGTRATPRTGAGVKGAATPRAKGGVKTKTAAKGAATLETKGAATPKTATRAKGGVKTKTAAKAGAKAGTNGGAKVRRARG